MEPIKDVQVFQFIEHLTLEDLQDIVKDIYALPTTESFECGHSMIRAKINILNYVAQDYVQQSYWDKILGEVPPPDMGSNDE